MVTPAQPPLPTPWEGASPLRSGAGEPGGRESQREGRGTLDRRLRVFVAEWFAPGATFVLAMLLYVPTLMPGLAFWDTAEYQTVGPVLGIAHPTGFPTYTLVTWLANLLLTPAGETAYRLNLFSAICVAAACGLVAWTVQRLAGRRALAVAAGLLLATVPIAWWTAVRAESHALHLFFVALILALLVSWALRVRAGRTDAGTPLFSAAVVFGLSLGNHGLTVLLAPGIALFLLAVDWRILARLRLLAACAAGLVLAAVAVYAYIPLRAAMHPPLDYAHPDTPARFAYLVLATQFHGLLQDPFQGGVEAVARLFSDQVGPLILLLGVFGLVALFLSWGRTGTLGPPLGLMTGAWFVLTTAFARVYADGYVERFYLGPILVLVVLAAIGVAAAWDETAAVRRRLWRALRGPVLPRAMVGFLAAAVLLVVPAVHALQVRASADASRDTSAQQWADAALKALPPNAVVVSWWSYSTPLWYEKYVAGRRPDILIVDDRDRLDDNYGDLPATIDRFLAQGRPVYVIRPEDEIAALSQRYRLQEVDTKTGYSSLYRVVP